MIDKLFAWCAQHWSQLIILAIALQTLLKAIHDAVDNCPPKHKGVMKAIVVTQLVLGYLLAGVRPRKKEDRNA